MAMCLKDNQHVVIDTKAAASKAELEDLVEGSSLLIVPTFANIMSLDTLSETIDSLRGLDIGKFRVLLTNIPPKPQRDGEAARAALEAMGLPTFKTQIRRSKAFERAAERGVTVGEVRGYDASQLAAQDYEDLCNEIGEIINREGVK
jgi:chromosome partitioning protein